MSLKCLATRSSRHPSAFTLVEMLIVFVIVAILIGILVPVISGAYNRGREAAEKAEIENLVTSLQKFKDRYGVYPPSQIILREDGAYTSAAVPVIPSGQDTAVFVEPISIQYLRRIWPQMVINTNGNPVTYTNNGAASDINRSSNTANDSNDFYDWNGDGQLNGPWYLQGDECLAFFLGGIAVGELTPGAGPTGRQTGPASYIGFSKRPHNPAENPIWLALFSNPGTTAAANRESPFFEFSTDRLMDRDSDGYYEIIPLRNFGQAAYMYFSGYEGAGYRPDDINLTQEPNGASVNTVDFGVTWTVPQNYPSPPRSPSAPYYIQSDAPNPYTVGPAYSNAVGWVPRYVKPDAFQIISPGAGMGYGDGGEFPLPTTGNLEDKDNLTNFSGSELKEGN